MRPIRKERNVWRTMFLGDPLWLCLTFFLRSVCSRRLPVDGQQSSKISKLTQFWLIFAFQSQLFKMRFCNPNILTYSGPAWPSLCSLLPALRTVSSSSANPAGISYACVNLPISITEILNPRTTNSTAQYRRLAAQTLNPESPQQIKNEERQCQKENETNTRAGLDKKADTKNANLFWAIVSSTDDI